jgi:hypothetical protein
LLVAIWADISGFPFDRPKVRDTIKRMTTDFATIGFRHQNYDEKDDDYRR